MDSSPALTETGLSGTGARQPRVLLIGMMGAGKSTVGRVLSARLGWPYLDSDERVEARTGRTVAQIFESSGEAAFRAEEAAVLAEATSADGPAVVSVAGGAVLDAENRRRIEQAGLVVWLRAAVPTLAARVGAGVGRPLLAGDPAGELARLLVEREPLYRALADVTVDVDHLTAEEVVDRIEPALAGGGR
jgi:shikimate kinase